MNEQQFGYAVRQELDQAAAALPEHVTRRLHAARTASLDHLPDAPSAAHAGDPDTPGLLTRLAIGGLPVAFMAVALFGITQWADDQQSEQFAQEMAALDLAVLTDELPLQAFTDKGFAVFLENTRQ
jgi:hypothetical protein